MNPIFLIILIISFIWFFFSEDSSEGKFEKEEVECMVCGNKLPKQQAVEFRLRHNEAGALTDFLLGHKECIESTDLFKENAGKTWPQHF